MPNLKLTLKNNSFLFSWIVAIDLFGFVGTRWDMPYDTHGRKRLGNTSSEPYSWQAAGSGRQGASQGIRTEKLVENQNDQIGMQRNWEFDLGNV